MQISGVPGPGWANPAAAAQQANSDPRSAAAPSAAAAAAKPANGDVERSSETLDRDANGQYDGSPTGRRRTPEENASGDAPQQNDGKSILELPAIGQASELDLLG